MRNLAIALALALALSSAGCLGFFKKGGEDRKIDGQQTLADELLGDAGRSAFDDLASSKPKNFTFPAQDALPRTVVWINGTVGPEANLAFEGNRDQGGIDYNSVVQTQDISAHVPPGQPVEIFVKLYWNAQEMNSADLDIVADLPGTRTSHYPAKTEDMNWNFATKTLTINTVGVEGQPHLLGIQANSGRTTGDLSYSMFVEFNYAKDVLPPSVPYAVMVPSNATGLVFESAKVTGDEHVQAEFIVVSPTDELVAYVEFNDLAIPTESVFVPTTGPGEYVLYAFYMHGGFLSVKADAALDQLAARQLATVIAQTTVDSAPSPGMIGRDWSYGSAIEGTLVTPMTNQKTASFDIAGAHPLLVHATLKGQGTLMTQAVITSPAGLVHELTRALRYDDERGSIGYTADEGYDSFLDYGAIVKGAYTIDYVNDGPLEVGYVVVTYQR